MSQNCLMTVIIWCSDSWSSVFSYFVANLWGKIHATHLHKENYGTTDKENEMNRAEGCSEKRKDCGVP
jgi:ATP/ADP translocase